MFFGSIGLFVEISNLFDKSGLKSVYTSDIIIAAIFFILFVPIWNLLIYFEALTPLAIYIIIFLSTIPVYGLSRGLIGFVVQIMQNNTIENKTSLLFQSLGIIVAIVGILVTAI